MWTDKLDYAPGETATIAGAGFAPSDVITLEVDHAGDLEGGAGHEPWTVTAGPDGAFSTEWYVDPDDSLGALFTLVADGESGLHAEVSFTDTAAIHVRNLSESGWYNPFHDPGNGNYYVGTGYRDFFVFNLAGVRGTVTSVRLQARGYCRQTIGGPYAVYDVSTPIGTLVAGGSRPDIHNDLGSGVQYGSTTVSFSSSAFQYAGHVVAVDFNANGRAAVQAAEGGYFAIGGNFGGAGFILGCTSGYPWAPADVQLVVTVDEGDTTPPVLSLPGPITLEATGPAGAVATYTATADDAVSGPCPVSCTPPSGGTFALGSTEVHCTATDASGNVASGQFQVVVADTTPPAVEPVESVTIEATSSCGTGAHYEVPAAHDAVDGDVAAHCEPAPGSALCLGETTVSCTATDSRGNASTVYGHIRVQDTTPPSLDVPGEIHAELTQPEGAPVAIAAHAADAVDGAVAVVCAPESGSVFPLGTTLARCTATDSSGNASSADVSVVIEDTTAPAIVVPGDIVIEAAGPETAIDWAVSATDLSGPPAVSCDRAPGMFALGTTAVTCTATDASGNAASGSFHVVVVDTTPPLLAAPAPMTLEATGPCATIADFALPIAHDVVDGDFAAHCEPSPGSAFCLGETAVLCSATDRSGNAVTVAGAVRIVDTTPPVLSMPADLTLEATGPAGAASTFAPAAVDAHDGDLLVSCDHLSGGTFALGATTVTCVATDASGNSASGSFTVRVVDTTAPVVTPPADATAVATSAAGAVVSYGAASATDVVSGAIAPSCTPASGSTFAPGTTVVSCHATDAAGNTGSATFRVTVSFAWGGFLQPINLDGSSLFRGGRTVPVKFRLSGASAGITTLVARLYLAKVSNGVIGTDEEVTSTSSADSGNTFRYSATDDTYIFNLATRGLSEGTYQLRADLGDGVSRTVLISVGR